jgi:hypothetical protein
MPSETNPPATSTGRSMDGDATEDLRLARLHLRLGMLAMARAELEDLAGRGALDLDGQASLAEARWRGGDLDGAADAAVAHLAEGGDDPVAIVIAAEAVAIDGQAAEARALAQRLGAMDPATIDAIFAGLPRRAHWPATGDATAPAAAASGGGGVRTGAPVRASAVPGPEEVYESNAGLWDEPRPGEVAAAQRAASEPVVEPARAKAQVDPEEELEAARDELGHAPERGLLRLALALRLDPTLAPDVIDAIRLRREPAASLLRGDAERLLGRHLEAEAAFADAIDAVDREALSDRPADPRAADTGIGHHSEPDRVEDS